MLFSNGNPAGGVAGGGGDHSAIGSGELLKEGNMGDLDDNKRTVRRYFELLSRNDVAGLLEIYDDSMVLHVPGNTCTSGTYDKARLLELAGMVRTAFPRAATDIADAAAKRATPTR